MKSYARGIAARELGHGYDSPVTFRMQMLPTCRGFEKKKTLKEKSGSGHFRIRRAFTTAKSNWRATRNVFQANRLVELRRDKKSRVACRWILGYSVQPPARLRPGENSTEVAPSSTPYTEDARGSCAVLVFRHRGLHLADQQSMQQSGPGHGTA